MEIILKISLLIILNLSLINRISSQNINKRSIILKEAYKEFNEGFRNKNKIKKEEHFIVAKNLFLESINGYPDGWDNIIERIYLSVIENEFGNKLSSKEQFELILKSQFSYDINTIYGDTEKGLIWYIIKEIYLDENNCPDTETFMRLYKLDYVEKFYFYKNNVYERQQKDPFYDPFHHVDMYSPVSKMRNTYFYCFKGFEKLSKTSIDLKYLDWLPERLRLYIKLVTESFAKEEIQREINKSMESIEYGDKRWRLKIFNNEISLSYDRLITGDLDKWISKLGKENLTKEEMTVILKDLYQETKFYKTLSNYVE